MLPLIFLLLLFSLRIYFFFLLVFTFLFYRLNVAIYKIDSLGEIVHVKVERIDRFNFEPDSVVKILFIVSIFPLVGILLVFHRIQVVKHLPFNNLLPLTFFDDSFLKKGNQLFSLIFR